MECVNEILEIIRGEERILPLKIQKKNGDPFNISTADDITVRLKNADNSVLSKTLTGGFVTVVDGPAGKFNVILSEAETTLLKKGTALDFTVDFQFGTVLRKANFYKALTVIDGSV